MTIGAGEIVAGIAFRHVGHVRSDIGVSGGDEVAALADLETLRVARQGADFGHGPDGAALRLGLHPSRRVQNHAREQSRDRDVDKPASHEAPKPEYALGHVWTSAKRRYRSLATSIRRGHAVNADDPFQSASIRAASAAPDERHQFAITVMNSTLVSSGRLAM